MINLATKQKATIAKRLGILTAAWGRSRLTADVMRYYLTIAPAHRWEIQPLVVWSPEDEDPPGDVTGWWYMEHSNQWLGKKWNAGARALFANGCDAIMIVGSDDLVSQQYFNLAFEQLNRRVDLISVRDLFIYEPPAEYVYFCRSMASGVGRVVTKRAFELVNGRLWDADLNSHLDSSIMSRMREVNVQRHTARNMDKRSLAVVDIKLADGPQIWRLVDDGPHGEKGLRQDGGALLHIRKTELLPAGQFFADYFPRITNYRALGTGRAHEQTGPSTPKR